MMQDPSLSVEPSSPPPPSTDDTNNNHPRWRSQDQVRQHVAPLLQQQGTVYRKTVSSFIRKARPGERISTILNGIEETHNTVQNDTSWVVCGKAAGECYVLSQEQFQESYDTTKAQEITSSRELAQQGFWEYPSRRRIWARQVDAHDMEFFQSGNNKTTATIVSDDETVQKSGDDASYFIAPWGTPMRVEVGDFLATQYPDGSDGIYRIERKAFEYSYVVWNEDVNDGVV